MRAARLLLVVAILLASTVAGSRRAAAASAVLTLQDQTLVVPQNGPLSFTVAVSGAPAGSELIVRLCRNLRTGETMADAIAGRLDCAALGLFPRVAITDAPITVNWPSYTRKTDKPDVALGEADPVQLPNVGTYPVQIEVHSGDADDIVARLVTFVIRAPVATALPTVAVSTVFTLPDHVTLRPDGSTVVEPAARDELVRLTRLLQARPNDPLAVSVSPAVLAALAAAPGDQHLVTDLVTALGNRPLLPRTFDGMSMSGALAAGAHDDLVDDVRAGEDALRAATGRAPDRRTWLVDDTVDNATLDTLGELGASQLLIPSAALGLRPDEHVSGRLTVQGSEASRRLPPDVAAIADIESQTLAVATDPVLASYRLAASWLSDAYATVTPAAVVNLGMVLVAPQDWWQTAGTSPEQTLGVLARIPQLRLVGLDDWFRTVPAMRDASGPVARRLTPHEHPDLAGITRQLATVRDEVAATSSMLPGATLDTDVEPLLHASLGAGLDDAARATYVQAVRTKLDAIRNSVEPIPKRAITIAGGVTRLPLNLRSTYSAPINVKLRLTSSKLKFVGSEGSADATGRYEQLITLEPNVDTRVVVPVESRATNTFPLIVEVLTPTGDDGLITPSELTIRANRLSGLGVALSAGGLVVLATWWAHHLRRNRRMRHASASAGRHPSNEPSPGETPRDDTSPEVDEGRSTSLTPP
jgi:hypothetical protein